MVFLPLENNIKPTKKRKMKDSQNEVSEITTFQVTYFNMGHFNILLCLISCEEATKNVSAVEVSVIDFSN